jgi:sulfur-carrier protein adenylyltransferase/sulfurtransferase
MESQSLSNQELRRFKRQISIPGVGTIGQEKLKNSKVIVIGVGGIGSASLQYLTAAGVGELGICDNKVIEEENFQNHVIFNSLDLGKQKAIISKLKLEAHNNFNHYRVLNIFVTSENAFKICSDFELVIDATNDPQIGLILDEACFKQKVPLIYAENTQFGSKISVFNYLKGPRLIDFYDLQASGPQNTHDKSNFGTFGAIEGIIGNIMALEALKILTGKGKVLSGAFIFIDPVNLMIEYKRFD